MYLTTEFLNLSGGASDSAFLHGQAKRQMTTEKQLPDAIFQLSCFEAVSIDIERNKGDKSHIVSFKVKEPEGNVLFSGMFLSSSALKEGLNRKQSFQYLVRKFDKNDVMVVKPSSSKSKIRGFVVQAPDGNTVGFIQPQPNKKFQIYDAAGTLLYSSFPNYEETSCSCCCSSAKKNDCPPLFDIKTENSKQNVANIEIVYQKRRKTGAVLYYEQKEEEKKIIILIGFSVILCTSNETIPE